MIASSSLYSISRSLVVVNSTEFNGTFDLSVEIVDLLRDDSLLPRTDGQAQQQFFNLVQFVVDLLDRSIDFFHSTHFTLLVVSVCVYYMPKLPKCQSFLELCGHCVGCVVVLDKDLAHILTFAVLVKVDDLVAEIPAVGDAQELRSLETAHGIAAGIQDLGQPFRAQGRQRFKRIC